MLLDDIRQHLVSGGVSSALIFKGALPDTPDRCVGIIEAPGSPPDWTMTRTAPNFERAQVQVLTRDAKGEYEAARALADGVFRIMAAVQQTTINAVRYLKMEAVQSPFSIGPDDNERPMLSCNYMVWKDLS